MFSESETVMIFISYQNAGVRFLACKAWVGSYSVDVDVNIDDGSSVVVKYQGDAKPLTAQWQGTFVSHYLPGINLWSSCWKYRSRPVIQSSITLKLSRR